jgi:hydrogenase expression/formation protein HypC
MCLAIPSRIVKMNNMMATVDVMGARRDISLMLLPEEVAEGDFVLVHAGFAIQKVSEEAAHDSLRLLRELVREMEQADNPDTPPVS